MTSAVLVSWPIWYVHSVEHSENSVSQKSVCINVISDIEWTPYLHILYMYARNMNTGIEA